MTLNAAFNKAMGKNIAELRQARGLTQEQLAAKLQINGCDLTRSALAKIEVGQRHIYPDELRAFKLLFGISYEHLLLESNRDTPR